jgi:hypothetical protein
MLLTLFTYSLAALPVLYALAGALASDTRGRVA